MIEHITEVKLALVEWSCSELYLPLG